jgi:hypothetical protein
MSKSDAQDTNRKECSFKKITPSDGARYIEQMIVHCLTHHADIVPWLRGSVHTDMLEFTLDWSKRDILARRSGTYKDKSGVIAVKDQTFAEYREALSEEVRKSLNNVTQGDNNSQGKITDGVITEILFPKKMAKARADNRAKLFSHAQALLGKAMLLWPASDVKELMAVNYKLNHAVDTLDLIGFVNALKEFCLEASGNVDNNIRAAENYVTELRMEKGKFTEYIRDFKAAADNLERCGSLFTQERIITLLIKNFDQHDFLNFYVQYLDKHHHLNTLKQGSLQEAINHLCEYYNTVVRVRDDESSLGSASNSDNHGPIRVFNQKGLRRAMAAPQNKTSSYVVSHEVLISMIAKPKPGDKRKKDKEKGAKDTKTSGEATDETDEEEPPVKKGKCWNFEKNEKCRFGADCKFEH